MPLHPHAATWFARRLTPNVHALYVTGSAALGDYWPRRSDHDYVALDRQGALLFPRGPLTALLRRELLTHAVCLRGPPASDWVKPPTDEELAAEQRTNQQAYWRPWLALHERLPLIAAWPRLTEWGVLGVARQLHTVLTGEIVSKARAGELLFGRISPRHDEVIRQAIAIRRGALLRPSLTRWRATLDCMRDTMELYCP